MSKQIITSIINDLTKLHGKLNVTFTNESDYYAIKVSKHGFIIHYHCFYHDLFKPVCRVNGKEYFAHHCVDVTDTFPKWCEANEIDLDNLTREDKMLIRLVWG